MAFTRIMAFLFVVAASLAAAAAAPTNCAACSGVLAPVMGADGLPYINACVARCSGTTVAAAGAPSNQASYAGRSVSSSLMQEHAAEGFRFINFDRVMAKKASSNAATSAPSLGQVPTDRIVRYDVAHGAIYASAAPIPVAEQQQEEEPTQVLRKLQQAGVSSSTAGAAVGQLLTYGERSRCTATLVAGRTVITAASCVFDRKTGAFARSLYFVLGRTRTAGGLVVAPHGAADVAEVFLLSSFITSSDDVSTSDIAVVRLQSSATTGKAFSYGAAPAAPKQQEQPQIAASRRMLLTATTGASNAFWTAGYPSTAQEGAQVEAECSAHQQADGLLKVDCKTQASQAGSPLYNAQGVLSGVITGAATTAVRITPALWQTLVKPYLV